MEKIRFRDWLFDVAPRNKYKKYYLSSDGTMDFFERCNRSEYADRVRKAADGDAVVDGIIYEVILEAANGMIPMYDGNPMTIMYMRVVNRLQDYLNGSKVTCKVLGEVFKKGMTTIVMNGIDMVDDEYDETPDVFYYTKDEWVSYLLELDKIEALEYTAMLNGMKKEAPDDVVEFIDDIQLSVRDARKKRSQAKWVESRKCK